eukprot:scpid47800/ scgid35565/ 
MRARGAERASMSASASPGWSEWSTTSAGGEAQTANVTSGDAAVTAAAARMTAHQSAKSAVGQPAPSQPPRRSTKSMPAQPAASQAPRQSTESTPPQPAASKSTYNPLEDE